MRLLARSDAQTGRRAALAAWRAAIGASLAMLVSCGASGDFGRVRPSLVPDGIHDWLGREAAQSNGQPASEYNLTDDERLLRDLAYPLIEPPYDRQRWYSVLGEFGITRIFRSDWWYSDSAAFTRHLMTNTPMLGNMPVLLNPTVFGPSFRSTAGRYSQLIDDIRNDVVRIAPFFETARRIIDLDRKRQQSLAYVSGLTPAESANALSRIGENVLVVGWVQCSLAARVAAFRFALERLVIAEPARIAVEADRALTLLQIRVAENRIVPPPPFCRAAIPQAAPGAGAKITK